MALAPLKSLVAQDGGGPRKSFGNLVQNSWCPQQLDLHTRCDLGTGHVKKDQPRLERLSTSRDSATPWSLKDVLPLTVAEIQQLASKFDPVAAAKRAVQATSPDRGTLQTVTTDMRGIRTCASRRWSDSGDSMRKPCFGCRELSESYFA